MTFEELTHRNDSIKADPIYFHMPDFQHHVKIFNLVYSLYRDHPYVFYPGATIGSVFGCFDAAIWNGGSVFAGGNLTYEQIKLIINHYNYTLNFPLTFTFTNPCIDKIEQCYDTYCNTIAELGNNGKNSIVISSPVLEEYLRKRYTNYKYCRSVIASEHIPYDLTNYDLCVIKRAKNNDWDYLNTIPMEERGRIEFLLNDPCPDGCKRAYSHYRDLGRNQILNSYGTNMDELNCSYDTTLFRTRMMHDNRTYISKEQVYNQYVPAGFKHFKCSGRGMFSRCMLSVLNYMIYPDFYEDITMAALDNYVLTTDYMDHVLNWQDDQLLNG